MLFLRTKFVSSAVSHRAAAERNSFERKPGISAFPSWRNAPHPDHGALNTTRYRSQAAWDMAQKAKFRLLSCKDPQSGPVGCNIVRDKLAEDRPTRDGVANLLKVVSAVGIEPTTY